MPTEIRSTEVARGGTIFPPGYRTISSSRTGLARTGRGSTHFIAPATHSDRRVSGDVHDIDGLLDALSTAGGHEGVVIQERLFDAAPLSTLCGRRGLQTMRINTLLHPDGRVSILFYMIKILAGKTLSDNFSMGTTGNLIAFGDDDCVLRGAVTIHECGSGMTVVTSHPRRNRVGWIRVAALV